MTLQVESINPTVEEPKIDKPKNNDNKPLSGSSGSEVVTTHIGTNLPSGSNGSGKKEPKTCPKCVICQASHATLPIRTPTKDIQQQIKDEDEAGAILDFRCSKCHSCPDCRSADKVRTRSIKDEYEQTLIENSIHLDFENQIAWADFPWKKDPRTLIKERWQGQKSNLKMARKVLEQQCKLPAEKRINIAKFMSELYDKGFIKPFKELSEEWQAIIEASDIHHFFPFRCVDNPKSPTTPHRVVVDPSMSGMNSCLPKGENNLCALIELQLDFRSNKVAYCYDIQKMYNMLKMTPQALPFQLFLWKENLDSEVEEQLWLFVSAIYGVICSGNQATAAIRQAAKILEKKYPLGAHAIRYRTYVDDGFGSAASLEDVHQIVDEVRAILSSIGFILKVATFSGEKPTIKASKNAESVGIGGYQWLPETEEMKLGFGEINFNPKKRGSKKPNPTPINTPEDLEFIWPDARKWTRRLLLSKHAECWDLMGMSEPVRVDWKLALKSLNGMSWDDCIPADTIESWKVRIRDIFETQKLTWKRCIVPEDATEPLEIRLINCNDGSLDVSAAGVWAGVKRRDGSYSCQLLFSKSRLASQTVPRNELDSCVLGTAATEICKRALGAKCHEIIRVTDSTVGLCWICNPAIFLKIYPFNRVKEILRWSPPVEWFHVPGTLNPADRATRPGMKAAEIGENSVWRNGFAWMRKSTEEMVELLKYEDFAPRMSEDDREEVEKEIWSTADLDFLTLESDDQELMRRSRNEAKIDMQENSEDVELKKSVILQIAEESLIQVDLNVTKGPKSLAQILDPIRHGWRKTITVTKIVFHFINAAIHHSHMRTFCKCSKDLQCTGSCQTTRDDLAKKCPICLNLADTMDDWNQEHLVKRWAAQHPKVDVHLSCEETCALTVLRDSSFITRSAEKQLLKEAKVSKVPVYGSRTRECLCKPVCKNEGCKEWDDALSSAKTAQLPERQSMKYWAKCASQKIREQMSPTQIKSKFMEHDGIFYFGGRLANTTEFTFRDLNLKFLENEDTKFNFLRPVVLGTSPIGYALSMYFHWTIAPHCGVEYTLYKLLQVFHVTQARLLMSRIRKDCRRCRYLLLRTLRVEMSTISKFQVTISPAFYSCQADIFGHFEAKQGRSTVKVWGLILVCCLTSATSIQVMESYKTEAFIDALSRHSTRYGYPCFLLPDRGSQLVCGSEQATFDFRDLQQMLHKNQKFNVRLSATKCHEEHGKVERRIQTVRRIVEQVNFHGSNLTPMGYQTFFYIAANTINNMPLAVARNRKLGSPLDLCEVITPNTMLLGRNNEREPAGFFRMENDPTIIAEQNEQIMESFFKLLMSSIHRLIPPQKTKGKWSKGNVYLSIGDIVLFQKEETFKGDWHYGEVTSKPEGRFRKVKVSYKSPSGTWEVTERCERDLCLINSIDEIDLNTTEHQLAVAADMAYKHGLPIDEISKNKAF